LCCRSRKCPYPANQRKADGTELQGDESIEANPELPGELGLQTKKPFVGG